MPTGFEGYKLSELERIAYDTQNFLAQEVLERCSRDVELEYQTEASLKRKTKWAREEAA